MFRWAFGSLLALGLVLAMTPGIEASHAGKTGYSQVAKGKHGKGKGKHGKGKHKHHKRGSASA